nr:immunoglobulin heavy chain junction region [Mus musculus]MBK4189171.1 immunoglobulin heavy chain junction region [Mus musculus]
CARREITTVVATWRYFDYW